MKTYPRIHRRTRLLLWILCICGTIISPSDAKGRLVGGESSTGGPAVEHVLSGSSRILRLESIRITGSRRTSENIILGHIRLRPGDEVTAEAIEADRQRLVATDYFSEVQFSTRPGERRGAVVLVIEVKERGYPTFETGYGYHDLHGWFLTLGGLRFDNPLGVESRLRVGARLGFRLAGFDLEWAKPLSAGGRFGLVVELHSYSMQHRFFGSGPGTGGDGETQLPWNGGGWRQYQQKIQRTGGEIALHYGIGRPTRFSFGVRAEYVNPDSNFSDHETDEDLVFNDFPGVLKDNIDDTVHTGFFLRAIRDTRDNPDYPHSGLFTRLTLEVNNSLLGGDEIFTRTDADVRGHVDLQDGWVLSGRLNAGITTRGTPYYDRFYVGGIYSIRGFEEWSLSQTDGDDGFWLTAIELRVPLAGRARMQSSRSAPRLSGLVFFDAGQGWRRDEAFSTAGVESAFGYGVRLRLPWLGTLGFDVGIPISEGRTDDPFRVHGSLGFSF